MQVENLASFLDHTYLRPDADEETIKNAVQIAIKANAYGLCVNPSWVPFSKSLLAGSSVKLVSVVGFSLGSTTTLSKVFEAAELVKLGADEIDMVANHGLLKSNRLQDYTKDIAEVARACSGQTLKVIIETSLLNDEEKKRAAELCVKAGAQFVKTSTGFHGGGANASDIKLLRQIVGNAAKIKASGGIRTNEAALEMIHAGADRIGTSSSLEILNVSGGKDAVSGNY